MIRLFYYLKDFYYLCILNIRDMTCERMLELICLTNFLTRERKNCANNPYYTKVLHNYVNVDMMENRRSELESELLKPYVIDNAEKSE